MSLNASLNIANSGLRTIEDAMAITSQNITNAQTAGYSSASANITSTTTAGYGTGAITGKTTLNIVDSLQKSLYNQNSAVSSATTISNSLASVSAAQGTTTSSDTSTTVGTLTNSLQAVNTAFVSLTSTPNDSSAQQGVVTAAQTLTQNINSLSNVYQQQRQAAQDGVTSTIKSINSDLTSIGAVSKQIMLAKANGSQTADLENQRYETLNDLSSKLGISYSEKANGDMTVTTQDGVVLPTRPDQINLEDSSVQTPTDSWPLQNKSSTVTPSTYASADGKDGISTITVANSPTDITSHLTGGTLGGDLTLRDQTYPKMQAQLDSFSYALISRFSNAGTNLFTNGTSQSLSSDTSKTTPDGLTGLASAISVNQTYVDTPSTLTKNSDGTVSSDNITKVLNTAFSTDTSVNTGSLEAPSTGLGPDGQQTTDYQGTQGLVSLSTSLITNQAGVVSNAKNTLSTATSLQSAISTKVSSVSGVDTNSQLANVTTLQNSYAANAKVFSTVQTMFNALLSAIQ